MYVLLCAVVLLWLYFAICDYGYIIALYSIFVSGGHSWVVVIDRFFICFDFRDIQSAFIYLFHICLIFYKQIVFEQIKQAEIKPKYDINVYSLNINGGIIIFFFIKSFNRLPHIQA